VILELLGATSYQQNFLENDMGQNIKQQIVEFITTNFLFDESNNVLGEVDSLLETGVIDSTGVLELVAFIEETYGIKIDDEEIVPENLDSIANITLFVTQKLSQRSTQQVAQSS
jgi:acyl carrier protein